MTDTATRIWSEQQQNIFEWFRSRRVFESPGTLIYQTNPNLVVVALAGTGKTTTIIEAVRYAPEERILLCAFNKRIADELTSRLSASNPNAVAKTLHAVGFAAVKRWWTNVRPDGGNHRADSLTEAVCAPVVFQNEDGTSIRRQVPDAVKRLISKLHTKGREIAPHATTLGDLSDLLITFECEPDEAWVAMGFDNAFVETKALAAMALAGDVKPADGVIDFSDMIFLPVRNGWLQKSYDLVVVDEAQDMTTAQLEIARGVCRGRIAVVGDPNQAIYGFRGADSNSIARLKAELNAAELTLTTTYRCGHAIVAAAQVYVPTFTAGASNPAGEIQRLPINKLVTTAEHGDFVLSRVNAPLVSIAMGLLRSGKRARVAGKDIGRGLLAIVRKLAKGAAANSVPVFIEKVGSWRDHEVARVMPQTNNPKTADAAQTKLDLIADQADMLVEIAEGATSVRDIESRIDSLFADDGLGAAGVVTCSSVHRSKGLEANRVFVLKDTLNKRPGQEENNITYVAITRAKQTLVYVYEDKAAK